MIINKGLKMSKKEIILAQKTNDLEYSQYNKVLSLY